MVMPHSLPADVLNAVTMVVDLTYTAFLVRNPALARTPMVPKVRSCCLLKIPGNLLPLGCLGQAQIDYSCTAAL